MKSATVVMLSFLVVVAGEANAQLAEPGAPIDHHAQPPGPPSASGTGEGYLEWMLPLERTAHH